MYDWPFSMYNSKTCIELHERFCFTHVQGPGTRMRSFLSNDTMFTTDESLLVNKIQKSRLCLVQRTVYITISRLSITNHRLLFNLVMSRNTKQEIELINDDAHWLVSMSNYYLEGFFKEKTGRHTFLPFQTPHALPVSLLIPSTIL